MDKIAILIQGPIRVESSFIEAKWNEYPIIWSTWTNETIQTQHTLIKNKPPTNPGIHNVAYQQLSTYNGLLKAKELGFTHCLKWRSDQYPINQKNLLSLFDNKKINVMFWHKYNGGYFVDYFMFGSIDNMINIWSFDPYKKANSPEELITNSIDAGNYDVHCIGDVLDSDNNIFWIKSGAIDDLSSYKNDKLFTTNRYE